MIDTALLRALRQETRGLAAAETSERRAAFASALTSFKGGEALTDGELLGRLLSRLEGGRPGRDEA
ncbi:MAG: hypothetical protein AAF676_16965 [Pseudomonadota bacterium]